MVEISIAAERLDLEVLGTHKLWAVKSRLQIPLEHVKSVHADPKPAMGWFQGLKVAGADIPHIFRAGMFWQDGGKIFWDVRHPKNTIVIELEDENCTKLIVEVKNPTATIKYIQQAIDDYQAAKAAAELELEQSLRGILEPRLLDMTIESEEPKRLKQGG